MGLSGADNIYVWHEGAIALVSTGGEEDDWTAHTLLYDSEVRAGPDEGVRSARVSGDGRTLMFTSRGSLTGYDNHGAGGNCAEHGEPAPCDEVYVYDAGSGGASSLTCVSCNPSGTPATSDALLYHAENDGSVPPPTLYPWELPRNLSEDGSRAFFETEEALLPADSNSVMDVYEWEREGAGSCPAGRGGGCLYLISSGVSSEPSYFAQASSSGGDVFFFTRQSLVGQDEDELVDLYDARVDGGIAAQNPPAPAAPCLGEACHPAQPPVPATGPLGQPAVLRSGRQRSGGGIEGGRETEIETEVEVDAAGRATRERRAGASSKAPHESKGKRAEQQAEGETMSDHTHDDGRARARVRTATSAPGAMRVPALRSAAAGAPWWPSCCSRFPRRRARAESSGSNASKCAPKKKTGRRRARPGSHPYALTMTFAFDRKPLSQAQKEAGLGDAGPLGEEIAEDDAKGVEATLPAGVAVNLLAVAAVLRTGARQAGVPGLEPGRRDRHRLSLCSGLLRRRDPGVQHRAVLAEGGRCARLHLRGRRLHRASDWQRSRRWRLWDLGAGAGPAADHGRGWLDADVVGRPVGGEPLPPAVHRRSVRRRAGG